MGNAAMDKCALGGQSKDNSGNGGGGAGKDKGTKGAVAAKDKGANVVVAAKEKHARANEKKLPTKRNRSPSPLVDAVSGGDASAAVASSGWA